MEWAGNDHICNQVSPQSLESHFQAYPQYCHLARIRLGDGCRANFWEDTWFGDQPLKTKFPHTYGLSTRHDTPISHFISSIQGNTIWNFHPSRDLYDRKASEMLDPLILLESIQITFLPDTITWTLGPYANTHVNPSSNTSFQDQTKTHFPTPKCFGNLLLLAKSRLSHGPPSIINQTCMICSKFANLTSVCL